MLATTCTMYMCVHMSTPHVRLHIHVYMQLFVVVYIHVVQMTSHQTHFAKRMSCLLWELFPFLFILFVVYTCTHTVASVCIVYMTLHAW